MTRKPTPIGTRFGMLTVIGSRTNSKRATIWACACDCGEQVGRQPSDLRNGKYLSCRRCAGPVLKRLGGNLVGRKIGRLTILSRVIGPENTTQWECACDCGGKITVPAYHLAQIEVPGCKDCSAARRGEAKLTHGAFVGIPKGTKQRLWRTWSSMHERCSNSNCSGWINYGGKGIVVCDEWVEFSAFRDWALANGYSDSLTIERRDSNRNYEPSNCEWITKSENSRRASIKAAGTRHILAITNPRSRRPYYPIEMFGGC